MAAPLRVMAVAFVLTVGLAAARASAQMPLPGAAGTAATRAAGMPLRDGALAPGILTVRIVRGSFDHNAANVTVQIDVAGRIERAATGADGRAQFAHLPVGAMVQASAVVDGEALLSERFEMAAESGIRLLLVAGEGSATASGVPADAAPITPAAVPAAAPAPVSAAPPEAGTRSEDAAVVGIRATFATATAVALALVVFGQYRWRPGRRRRRPSGT